ncbi:hypothetical protein CVT26_006991 [Gymnopilus dilepis]|uniref:Uncharacterized protein n=1 Tax=Gymnopilus dilepis TaxID=231916 RepID=A0A409W147_9AGAR|nr:hypothetical protein CVT26_006991 [Gymnopilus dilepis]
MKSVLSLALLAHSALGGMLLHGSAVERSYPPILVGRFLHRRQSTPVVGNLSASQAQAGFEAMCSSASSPSGSSAITADINNVTVNSLAIETEFRNVAAQLAFIDSENLNNGKTFAPAWNDLAQAWTNILWASRDTASDTVAYCQEFIDTIMPAALAESTTAPVGIELLQLYISEAESLEAQAQMTSDAFSALEKNLTTFTTMFNNFAVQLKQTDDGTIDSLLHDIAALNATISQLDKEINDIALALGVTVFVTVGASALLPEFAPLILGAGVIAVGGEAAAWGVLAKERSNDANQRSQDQAMVQELQQQETAIAQANSTLHSISNVTVPTMVTQLSAFVSIWNSVVSDCEQAKSYLNMTIQQSPIAPILPMTVWATFNHVPCIYEQVIPALNLYASGIDSSMIPPPTQGQLSLSSNWKKLTTTQFHARVQSMVSATLAKQVDTQAWI